MPEPILFLEDWKKHPGAMVHINTNNKTFLRMAAHLKAMGVKNHAFMLALYNKELEFVNPHDPNLTMDQMAMVTVECYQNPWYFFREVARAPGRAGTDNEIFRANRGNMSLYWLFFNHITTILIQIRQTGKSFSIDTLDTYIMNIGAKGTDIALLTKDDDLRATNLERLREIEGTLPFYLKRRKPTDIFNTEEFSISGLKNNYKGYLPSRSPKQANNVGRGITAPIFRIDEGAFLWNIGISLSSALAAGTAARDNARRSGSFYGTTITTTAGKKDDRDGRFIHNLLIESAQWNEKFYDAQNQEDLESIIKANSPKGEIRVNCTFNHRQLGYSDAWLARAVREAMVSGEAAARDFGNQWTSGSLTSPLSVEMSDKIRNSEVKDYHMEITRPHGYCLRWYTPLENIGRLMSSEHHIISVDSSDAVGQDDIALTIKSVKTGELVAAGNFNETNIITFAEWLAQLLIKYEKTTLIIERRSTGSAILDYLILMLVNKGIDPFKRIYNTVVQNREENEERFKEIARPMNLRDPEVYVRFKKYFGFATSGSGVTSRTDLYSTTLLSAAKYTGDKVKDTIVINQILGLIVKNGRVDHEDGGHDDSCISWLLSHWLLTKGRNLDFYGISARDVLVENKTMNETQNPIDQYKRYEQNKLRSEIEYLIEEIRLTKDPYVTRQLEMKLINLSGKLVLGENEHFSVDTLLEQLNEEKKLIRATASRSYYDRRSNATDMVVHRRNF